MPSVKRGYNARGFLHHWFDTPLENMASLSICIIQDKRTEEKSQLQQQFLKKMHKFTKDTKYKQNLMYDQMFPVVVDVGFH